MNPAGRNTLRYKMFLSYQHAPTHPPIFLPVELLSTCLSVLPLLLFVCQGTRASWMAEQGLQTKTPHSAPQELSEREPGSSSERLRKTQELLGLQSPGWSSKINHKQFISKISGMPTRSPLVHSIQQTHW